MKSNAEVTTDFLKSISETDKTTILGSIAKHYGITIEEAEAAVKDDDAECLLDYMVEPFRSATLYKMRSGGFIDW